MHDVGFGGGHLRQAGVHTRDAKLFGHLAGTLAVRIGDSYDLNVLQALERPRVISTDVTCPGQTYTDRCNRIIWECLHKRPNFRTRARFNPCFFVIKSTLISNLHNGSD